MEPDNPDSTSAGDPAADVDRLDTRERYVLYCLSTHGRMSLWDLADEVIVWETQTRLPDLSPSEPRKVFLALYHTHVPRMQRLGLVSHSPERNLVWLQDRARTLDCPEPSRRDGPGYAAQADT